MDAKWAARGYIGISILMRGSPLGCNRSYTEQTPEGMSMRMTRAKRVAIAGRANYVRRTSGLSETGDGMDIQGIWIQNRWTVLW